MFEVVQRLDEIRDQYQVPAYGFALVNADEIEFAGARGIADRASARAADSNTRFRIGSITKAFTALAVLIAINEGLFDLDTRLADLIDPDLYTNPWATTHPLRMVHLLEHSAGFADLTMAEMYHSDPKPLTLEDALRLKPANRHVLWRPALHYSYTNAGAGLAAYALEQRAGISYAVFVRDRIFVPLGMSNASVLLDEKTEALLATGYDSDGETPITYWHMLFRAFGAINATPRDMAAFIKLLINRGHYQGGDLLPADRIERMEYPKTTLAARSGLRFGYGLGIYAWYRDGVLFHGHGGDGDGYLAHLGYSRETGKGYFVVINAFKHAPLREMRIVIERYIARSVPPFQAPPPRDNIKMRNIQGTYQQATYRFRPGPDSQPERLEIMLDGGRLYTQQGDERRRALIRVNQHHFRRAEESRATIAIVEDDNGRIFFQGERENYVRIETDEAH